MLKKKDSKILKLPPVRNCFTLAMTDKLVVITNCPKYQKLRKFYYRKWNFLYQITAASRTPDQGATTPRSPFSLSSTEFVEPRPEQNSRVRHWQQTLCWTNRVVKWVLILCVWNSFLSYTAIYKLIKFTGMNFHAVVLKKSFRMVQIHIYICFTNPTSVNW